MKNIPEELFKSIQEVIVIPSINLILIKEGKVLLLKRKNGTFKGKWVLPGSRFLKGESVNQAARRVAQEDCGAVIGNISLLSQTMFYTNKMQELVTLYVAEIDSNIKPGVRYSNFSWFDSTMPEEVLELHKSFLEIYQNSKT